MKRLLTLTVVTLLCAVYAQAGDMKVDVKMAKDKDSEPTDTFAPDVRKIYAFFTTEGSTKGDKLRCVWIAEDVGDAADPNTTIDEASLTADKDNFVGAFSLSKPTKGWPEGSYRVDFYSGDNVVTSVNFMIEKPEESEKSEKSKDESTGD